MEPNPVASLQEETQNDLTIATQTFTSSTAQKDLTPAGPTLLSLQDNEIVQFNEDFLYYIETVVHEAKNNRWIDIFEEDFSEFGDEPPLEILQDAYSFFRTFLEEVRPPPSAETVAFLNKAEEILEVDDDFEQDLQANTPACPKHLPDLTEEEEENEETFPEISSLPTPQRETAAEFVLAPTLHRERPPRTPSPTSRITIPERVPTNNHPLSPAQEFIQVVNEFYLDEIPNDDREIFANSALHAQQERVRARVEQFIVEAPVREAQEAFSFWRLLTKVGDYVLPEKVTKPEFLELLNQDPTLATLAGLVWKQVSIQTTKVKPLAIFQIIVAIIAVLLQAILLGMSYSANDSSLKKGLTLTALITNLCSLLNSLCMIWKVTTVFNIKEITNVVYGLTERAASDNGSKPSDARYHEILRHISQSFNMSGIKIQDRVGEYSCVPPGSKFSPYARLLRSHLKTLSEKYPNMTTAPYLAIPLELEDNSDFLYKVFYDYRAFRGYTTEELTKTPENLTEDPRPFIKELVASIHTETGVDLSREPFPISTRDFFTPATYQISPTPQANNGFTTGVVKGIACVMGLFAMLAGKSITDFKSFFARIKNIRSAYVDTLNILYSIADFFSSWIYEIFGFDVLNIEAKKFQISIFKDTAAQIMTMSKESLGVIPGIKESLQKLLLDANEIQYDSWVLLDQADKSDFKRVISDFTKYISDIPEITKNSFRQIPVGVYFHGHPGSGKTELSLTLLTDSLKRDFGLNGAFTLKPDARGHNTAIPAGRGDIVIIDEVGTKTEDPIVENLTLIISATPWNCPSAFQKNQHFEPKVVVLINNQNNIQSASVKPESINAISSRLLSYEVVHDDFAKNPNIERDAMVRDPEFSNVKFYKWITYISGVVSKLETPMTFQEVYKEISEKLVYETKNHERRLNDAFVQTLKHCTTPTIEINKEVDPRTILQSLQEPDATDHFYQNFYTPAMEGKPFKLISIHQLALLGKALRSTICVHAGDKATVVHKGNGRICCKITPTGPLGSHKIFFNKALTMNQKSAQNFFTVHLTSSPGLGKTTLFEKRGRELASAFNCNFHKITACSYTEIENLKKETRKCVILFDDFVNSKPAEYQALYDYIPSGSIILITSNLKFIQTSSLVQKAWGLFCGGFKKAYKVVDNQHANFPKGWYRRLNFPGILFDNEGQEVIPDSSSCYHHDLQNFIETENWFNAVVMPGLVEFHKLEAPKEVRFSPEPPTTNCPTATFKNRESFFKIFETTETAKRAFVQAYLGLNPELKFANIPAELVNGEFDPQRFFADRSEHPLDIVERFGNLLRPLLKCEVLWRFEEENLYCLTGPSVIFHNLRDEEAGLSESFRVYNDGVLIQYPSNEADFYDWEDLALILASDKLSEVKHYTILKNREVLSPHLIAHGFTTERVSINSVAENLTTNYAKIISSIMTHPLFILASIVVACAVAAAGFWAFTKLFCAPEEEEEPRMENHLFEGNDYPAWADEVELYEEVNRADQPEVVLETNSGEWVARKRKPNKRTLRVGFNALRPHMGIATPSTSEDAIDDALEEISRIETDPNEKARAKLYSKKFDSEVLPVQCLQGQQTIVYSDANPKKKRLGRRATYQYAPLPLSGKNSNAQLIDKALCIAEFNGSFMHGVFLGGSIVATCSHLMTPDNFHRKEEITIKEKVDGQIKVWKAVPYFYGFSRASYFDGSKTELLLATILDKTFPPKQDLTKLCYSEQEMEEFSRLHYTLPGAILYTYDQTKFLANLEVNVNRTLLRTDSNNGEEQGQLISNPVYSHVLKNTHSVDKILKPGACGLPIFNPVATLGTPCIYGLHSLFRVESTSISFPIYRNALRQLMDQAPSRRVLKPQSGVVPELYSTFNGRTFKIGFPQGWQELIQSAPQNPTFLSETALNDTMTGLRDSPKLKFICKVPAADLSAPPRHKYKLTKVSPLIPYPPQKFPAPLFPGDLSDEGVTHAGKQFHVKNEDGNISGPVYAGVNIISKQLKMMDQGVSNESFLEKHSPNLEAAGLLFQKLFEKLVKQQKYEPNLKKEGPFKWRFLSDEEVFNGICDPSNPLKEGISSVQEDSSAGPTCYAMGVTQKKQMFCTVGTNMDGSEKRDLKPEFKKVYRDLITEMQAGNVVVFPDQAKLKSELLKPEKCEQANTRAYICRDAMMMLVEKKVFGILQGIFHHSKGDHFSAIGMDPILHFPKIFSRFRNKNLSKVLAADATRWDKNTLRAVMELVFKNIKAVAPWRNATKSSNLYDTLVCTILDTIFVSKDELFLVRGGMPSGTYVTTLVNICVHLFLLCLMIVTAIKQFNLKISPDKLAAKLFYIFMGDDFLLGVDEWFAKLVKATWIQDFYLSCNVILTNPQKTKTEIEYVPFSKMEFCSRTFKKFTIKGEDVFTFPLKKISIMADSHYTTHDTVETAISICRCKLIEAALHGPEFYQSEVNVVRTILKFYNASGVLMIPDWEDQLYMLTHKDALCFVPQSGRKPLASRYTANELISHTTTMSSESPIVEACPEFAKQTQRIKTFRTPSFLGFCQVLALEGAFNYFEGKRSSNNIRRLAHAGFVYEGPRDEVRCPWCQILIGGWQEDHDPWVEHVRKSPDCLFLNNAKGSIPAIDLAKISKVNPKFFASVMAYKNSVTEERVVGSPQSGRATGTPAPMAPTASTPGGASASTSGYMPVDLKEDPAGTIVAAQPSNEDYNSLANFGDPRNIFDCLSQDFVIKFMNIDAGQATGTVLARFPWGFNDAPDFIKTIFSMHKYTKGYKTYKLVVRGAGATGSLRISHVKDINRPTYTILDLQETNASYVADLSNINSSETLEIMVDYTHETKKVFSVDQLANGTFPFEPTCPGVVITVNTPVQNIFNSVSPWIEVSANFSGFVLTTPILTGVTPTPSGNTNLLSAMQGMTLAQIVQSFGDPMTKTASLFTDGCFSPDPSLASSQSGSSTGIDLEMPAEITVSTDLTAGAETDQPTIPDVISMCVSTDKTNTRGRIFVIQGTLPYNTQAQPNQNLEQALSTQCITAKTPTFPFPNLDGSDIDATVALLISDLKTKAGGAAMITTESSAVTPASVLSATFNFCSEDDGSYLPKEQVKVDLTANPILLTAKVVSFASAQFLGRLWIIDVDFPPALTKQFLPKSGLTNTVLPKEVTLKFLISPLKTPLVTPNIISASGMTQLPTTLRAVLIGDTDSTVSTKVGSNDGLPTCANAASSEFLRFVTRQLQPGQKAEFVLYSSSLGKVACVVYASRNFGRLYINSSTGKYYTKFQMESASSLIIQSVSVKNESENSTVTDDSAWLSRAATQQVIPSYKSSRVIAQPQALAIASMGASALGGLFSGLGQAASKNQELKQQAAQALADRQLKRDLANQSTDTQIQLADKSNSAMLQRTAATNQNQLAISNLTAANNWRIARMNNATQSSIAQGNNNTSMANAALGATTQKELAAIGHENVLASNETSERNSMRSLEATKFSAETGLAGTLATTGASLTNAALNAYVVQPAQQKNEIKKIDETGDQQRKTMLYQAQLQAGSNLAANT